MSALLSQRGRLLLPAWVTAMLAATLPVWLITNESNAEIFSLCGYAVGVLLIGLSSLGQEVNYGTWGLLFSQPASRSSLWWTKVSLAAMALLLVLSAHWGVPGGCAVIVTESEGAFLRQIFNLGGMLALLAFSGGLWTILVFRQTIVAFWVTLLTPTLICALLVGLRAKANRTLDTALLLYAAAGFIWSHWYFLRAQDVAWTGGNISVPASGRGRLARDGNVRTH